MIRKPLIPRLTALLPMLVLTGCLHAPVPSDHQYLLPAAGQASAAVSQPPIEVRLASYLDQDGIMVQTGPVEVHAARQHRWADPLPEQLRRALIVHLGQRSLPSDGQLLVEVVRFQGNGHGHAEVDGRWHYRDGHGEEQGGRFRERRPLHKDGYPELVKQLDAAWAAVAQSIAARLSAQPNG